MRDWLEEVWSVFCHSTKTQLAVAFGAFFFVGIMVMGQVLVGGLELHGPLVALTNVVRDNLMHRYDKAAWAALGSFASYQDVSQGPTPPSWRLTKINHTGNVKSCAPQKSLQLI